MCKNPKSVMSQPVYMHFHEVNTDFSHENKIHSSINTHCLNCIFRTENK